MNGNNLPLLYDLFCYAGGCTKGYQRAGFYVVGVDIVESPRYPGDEFIKMDAFEFLRRLLAGEFPEPALIHASPPCQKYSRLAYLTGKEYPDLVPPIRKLLQKVGIPYVIENVIGAPLINPIMLCGTMFGLRTERHRIFETSPAIWFPPAPCNHWGRTQKRGEISSFENGDFITVTGHNFIMADAKVAMGIDWMIGKEISQAIPPAFTEWVGKQLIKLV